MDLTKNPTTRFAVAAALGLVLGSCGGGYSSGGGGGGGGTALCSTTPGGGIMTVSGQAQFEFVPHNPATSGLDYAGTVSQPIRGATIQVRRGNVAGTCATGTVLGATTTDASGNYSIPNITWYEEAKVCVRAELLLADAGGGAPSWDVQVVDNTNASAIYVLETAGFCTNTGNQTKNLLATTGWGGAGYTGTRAAAPFAILDAVYKAIQKILAVEATADFPALDLNWSVNNTDSSGNLALGQIGTSFYSNDEIYILGDDNNDTDEFDDHVIIHEYGHYLEDNLSRSDSIGYQHSSGDLLDPRVAYGEGFGNAWSGIVTDDPVYRDSRLNLQASGFPIDVENDTVTATQTGWFSETSVQAVLYDLYDTTNEAGGTGDSGSVGLTPLWTTWRGAQSTTPTLTTIFSLLDGVRAAAPGSVAFIDALAGANGINGTDALGTGETNDASLGLSPAASCTTANRALPVYIAYTPGVTGTIGVPSSKVDGEYNKLGNRRFIRFTLGGAGSHTFTVTSPTGQDPDAYLFNAGVVVGGPHEAVGNESWTDNLPAGNYVLEVYPFTNVDEAFGQATAGGDICLLVTIT